MINELFETLNDCNFKFKKKFGQNFLIDKNIINKISKQVSGQNSLILEIGPGPGNLTEALIKHSKKLYAVEIDCVLCKLLKDKFKEFSNVEIINQDILKLDIEDTLKSYRENIVIIGNLPYYISTAIIMKILKLKLNFSKLIFMLQDEVAEKLLSTSGKNYGSLSVVFSYYALAKILFNVPSRCFVPRPKVSSVVIEIIKNNEFNNFYAEETFLKIVKNSFLHRRKTLINGLNKEFNIDKLYLCDILKKMGYNPSVRAENLKLLDYIKLSEMMFNVIF